MLLPALSRIIGVISQHGGYRGTPSRSQWKYLGLTVCFDKPSNIRPGLPPTLKSWPQPEVSGRLPLSSFPQFSGGGKPCFSLDVAVRDEVLRQL